MNAAVESLRYRAMVLSEALAERLALQRLNKVANLFERNQMRMDASWTEAEEVVVALVAQV